MSESILTETSNKRIHKLKRGRSTRNNSELRYIQSSLKNLHTILGSENELFDKCNGTQDQTLKKAVENAIDAHLSRDNNILKKIDFYITPYNKTQQFQESMSFGDKYKFCKTLDDKAQKDWKMVSNFVLNPTKDFRAKLNQYNPNLYGSIKKLALKLMAKRFNKSPKLRKNKRKQKTSEFKINVLEVNSENNPKSIEREFKNKNASIISPLIQIKRHEENLHRKREIRKNGKNLETFNFGVNLEMISNETTKPVSFGSKTNPKNTPIRRLRALDSSKYPSNLSKLMIPKLSAITVNAGSTEDLPTISSNQTVCRQEYKPPNHSEKCCSILSSKILSPIRAMSRDTKSKVGTPNISGDHESIDQTGSAKLSEEQRTYDNSSVDMENSNLARNSHRDTKLPLIHGRNLTVTRPRKTNSSHIVNEYTEERNTSYFYKQKKSASKNLGLGECDSESNSCSVSMENDENPCQNIKVFKEKSMNILQRVNKKTPSKSFKPLGEQIIAPLINPQKLKKKVIRKDKIKFASFDKENYKRIDSSWVIYSPQRKGTEGLTRKPRGKKSSALDQVKNSSNIKAIRRPDRSTKVRRPAPLNQNQDQHHSDFIPDVFNCKNNYTYGVKDARMFL
ncbi:unnamed protein product [Moneuplotes crassus]|uniref:Uncharacterized protein n=1 Tax=Euplotes crassus TaxID=5936 RepID=A0AAD2DAX7_EUPCR|nr:unnamed protein product [Moneuplotes crassus]